MKKIVKYGKNDSKNNNMKLFVIYNFIRFHIFVLVILRWNIKLYHIKPNSPKEQHREIIWLKKVYGIENRRGWI
jgi:hypothetical protein